MANTKSVLIGFFPVVHHRYLELLASFEQDTVYFFTEEILEDWDRFEHLKRDLRWKDLSEIPTLIEKAGLVKEIKALNKKTLEEVQHFEGTIVMPDEDVSHWFSKKYLEGNRVEFREVFLRADFNRANRLKKEDFIDPDAEITEDELHRQFMGEAELLARKSPDWWRQIGSVSVSNGKIIASACNHGLPSNFDTALYGDPRSQFDAGESIEICSCIHSESSVVAQAAKEGIPLDGADIYVTTFPCPVCAKLLSETGIKRVFYKEGYSRGEGKEVLRSAGVQLIKVN